MCVICFEDGQCPSCEEKFYLLNYSIDTKLWEEEFFSKKKAVCIQFQCKMEWEEEGCDWKSPRMWVYPDGLSVDEQKEYRDRSLK